MMHASGHDEGAGSSSSVVHDGLLLWLHGPHHHVGVRVLEDHVRQLRRRGRRLSWRTHGHERPGRIGTVLIHKVLVRTGHAVLILNILARILILKILNGAVIDVHIDVEVEITDRCKPVVGTWCKPVIVIHRRSLTRLGHVWRHHKHRNHIDGLHRWERRGWSGLLQLLRGNRAGRDETSSRRNLFVMLGRLDVRGYVIGLMLFGDNIWKFKYNQFTNEFKRKIIFVLDSIDNTK